MFRENEKVPTVQTMIIWHNPLFAGVETVVVSKLRVIMTLHTMPSIKNQSAVIANSMLLLIIISLYIQSQSRKRKLYKFNRI
jgi:hypothetical protein